MLHARFTFAEVRAAALVFGLVVLATFAVVIPYLVLDDPHVARLSSNAVSIVLLYVCGLILGRHCGAPGPDRHGHPGTQRGPWLDVSRGSTLQGSTRNLPGIRCA